MCNRFRSIHEWSEIPRFLQGQSRLNFDYNPNVAPTELTPAFIAHPGGPPRPMIARFGINLAGKHGKPRPPLLNARTDGLLRGQFRTHLKQRRCVIPAQGFYEWREEGGKQPYYFYRKNGAALMLAGIWEESEYKGDRRIAFAILTDEPNDLVASYHDRMPLALADGKVEAWLDLATSDPLQDSLLIDLQEFAVRPVNRALNNARQKDLSAIDPADPTAQQN
jgi:putative SOS response-associated peptidase YedK